MTHRPRTVLVVILALAGAAETLIGCGPSHSAPAGSTFAPTSPKPPAQGGPQPHIAAIAPTAVSNVGEWWGKITGTGFAPGVQVAFGGAAPHQIWLSDPTTIQVWDTNAHESGTVDVVVRNPGGSQDTLRQGFTFSPPESFDFNGRWVAYAGDDYGADMSFVVENNALTTVSCGAALVWSFATPPPIVHGEFKGVGEDGRRISGRIVSATSAIGAINIAPCAPSWWADKR